MSILESLDSVKHIFENPNGRMTVILKDGTRTEVSKNDGMALAEVITKQQALVDKYARENSSDPITQAEILKYGTPSRG